MEEGRPSRRITDRDELASIGSVLGFSLALGTWMVAMPLLALGSGWDAAGIGVLAVLSATAHLGTRVQMGWLLGRVPDRVLIVVACLLVATPYALLLISSEAWAFVAAQFFNGAARAVFWTASQTHVVRGSRPTVRALAQLHVLGSIGQIAGPVAAGLLLATAPAAALAGGLAVSLGGGLAGFGLALRPVYARRTGARFTWWWTSQGINAAAWASFTGGGWRAMLGSYVPVVLASAGNDAGLIGVLVGAADAASIVAAGIVARIRQELVTLSLRLGTLAAGAGLAAVALAPGSPLAVAVALGVSGIGAGLVTTLGPALAAEAAEAEAQGAAIALTGTFRAMALLVVPAGVAGLLAFVALPVAMLAVCVAMGLPALATELRRSA